MASILEDVLSGDNNTPERGGPNTNNRDQTPDRETGGESTSPLDAMGPVVDELQGLRQEFSTQAALDSGQRDTNTQSVVTAIERDPFYAVRAETIAALRLTLTLLRSPASTPLGAMINQMIPDVMDEGDRAETGDRTETAASATEDSSYAPSVTTVDASADDLAAEFFDDYLDFLYDPTSFALGQLLAEGALSSSEEARVPTIGEEEESKDKGGASVIDLLMMGLATIMVAVLAPFIAPILNALSGVLTAVASVVVALTPILLAIVGVITLLVPIIKILVQAVVDYIIPVIPVIVEILANLVDAIVRMLIPPIGIIATAIAKLVSAIIDVVISILQVVASALRVVARVIENVVGPILEAFAPVVVDFLRYIDENITVLGGYFLKLAGSVTNFTTTILDTMTSFILTTMEPVQKVMAELGVVLTKLTDSLLKFIIDLFYDDEEAEKIKEEMAEASAEVSARFDASQSNFLPEYQQASFRFYNASIAFHETTTVLLREILAASITGVSVLNAMAAQRGITSFEMVSVAVRNQLDTANTYATERVRGAFSAGKNENNENNTTVNNAVSQVVQLMGTALPDYVGGT